jgi:hypothetical protein
MMMGVDGADSGLCPVVNFSIIDIKPSNSVTRNLGSLIYCNIIGDYTVGSLVKNARWIYFTLLQLIISWINVCRFTNHSPDYLYINVLFCFVILFFQSPDTGR